MQETLLRSSRGSGGLRKDMETPSRETICKDVRKNQSVAIFLDPKGA